MFANYADIISTTGEVQESFLKLNVCISQLVYVVSGAGEVIEVSSSSSVFADLIFTVSESVVLPSSGVMRGSRSVWPQM